MSGLLLVKKAPGIKPATVSHFEPGTKSCLRCPGATTTYSMMRGSTLLLHLREATHFVNPTPKRPSPPRNCRPTTIYRLAATPARLLLFITVGECVCLYGTSIQEKSKRCKWFLVLDNKEGSTTLIG